MQTDWLRCCCGHRTCGWCLLCAFATVDWLLSSQLCLTEVQVVQYAAQLCKYLLAENRSQQLLLSLDGSVNFCWLGQGLRSFVCGCTAFVGYCACPSMQMCHHSCSSHHMMSVSTAGAHSRSKPCLVHPENSTNVQVWFWSYTNSQSNPGFPRHRFLEQGQGGVHHFFSQ